MNRLFVRAVVILGATVLFSCGGGGGSTPAPVPLPGDVAFSQATYVVNEDGTSLQSVTISRTGGSAGAVTVDVAFTNGSATGGTPPLTVPSDFDNSTQTVSFADGDTSDKTIVVPVLDDDDVEGPETVSLTLTNATGGATIGANAQATLTIIDDDNAGTISFSAASFSYGENGVPVVAITVTRTGGVDGTVGATITSTDGTANSDPASSVEPQDFVALNTTVGFSNQDATPQTIVLNGIVQDALPELDETFTVSLSSVTGGAATGALTTATVTIVDDDTVLTINNPAPGASDQFGAAVTAVGPILVVGAPGDTAAATANVGAVHRFNAATGAVIGAAIARPSQSIIGGGFGGTLTTLGADMVIGAPQDTGNGTVFIIDPLSGAVQQQFSGGACTGNGLFGTTMVVVGPTLLVGCPGALLLLPSTNCQGVGGLVFAVNPLTGVIFQSIQSPGGSAQSEAFGQSLTVGAGHVVAGAPGRESPIFGGLVDVFNATTFVQELTIPNPFPGLQDHFGQAVVVFNGKIIVGAPDDDTTGTNRGSVYVFDAGNGNLVQTIAPPSSVATGRFGAAIAVVRDRLCIQHQNAGTNTSGQVVIYDSAFNVVQTISNPTPTAAANFGAVMAECDGELLVGCPLHNVGATADAGIAYVIKVN